MTEKQKNRLMQLIVAGVIYFALMITEHAGVFQGSVSEYIYFGGYMVIYLFVGYKVLWKAVRNILNGQVFDENFLMCLATFGAIAVQEYSEAVAVMLFYQVGEWFEDYAVNRSRKSISDLMDICPEYANIEKDGVLMQVDPEEIAVGDTIIVKPGERVPLDGIVQKGNSMLDTSALTGESVPRSVRAGDEVISGCVNGSGTLELEVTKAFDDSTVMRILELVENASSKKSNAENFITKFARYYTPAVVIGAVALAVFTPILTDISVMASIKRACIFLVISCPCALVISVPLSFFGGIGAASKKGILVKGSNYLEAISKMSAIVFDKTGTLTKGDFVVTKVEPVEMTREELLETAALAEGYSDHPIAVSIRNEWKQELDLTKVNDVSEVAGHGIRAVVKGKEVLAGNMSLLCENEITCPSIQEDGTIVCLAIDGKYAGYLVIADEVKETAAEAIRRLKKLGVRETVMLTGDRAAVATAVGEKLGIDRVYSELLPQDKVEKAEMLLEETKGKGKLAFVGDGINDAPVLARCDIGIAMGSMGSDAAIEAADIVLMDDQPEKIATVVSIANKTMAIVKQNIVFALGVKFLVMALGAFGKANMWGAVFADVGVSVIAIINATRALKVKE